MRHRAIPLPLLAAVVMATGACSRAPDGHAPRSPAAAPAKAAPEQRQVATAAEIEKLREPLLPALRSSERDVARIKLVPLSADDPFVSKVGGAPYLPRGEALPETPADVTMVLLAQINFAELPAMDGYPREGIFQIFISPADGDTYGMDLSGDITPESLSTQKLFRTRYWPAPLLAREALHEIAPPDTQGRTPHAPRRPLRMRFLKEREEISAGDTDFPARFGIAPWEYIETGSDRLGVNVLELYERVYNTGQGHKVGGYPFFTQEDPRPPGTRLRLLLQLDSDEHLLWGDAGVGNVFIDPDDLRRADFSRVLYSWDCH